MPKRITDRPIQPKRRRRGGFNILTYEAVFIFLWLPALFISAWFFSTDPVERGYFDAERALIAAKVAVGVFLVITLILIRIDKLSVIREKESFAFSMKEYEMLRSKWLDAEAKRMDSEILEMSSESEPKSKVATNIISSGGIIVASPEEVGITSDSAVEDSEDD
jgi:hypothetical protein